MFGKNHFFEVKRKPLFNCDMEWAWDAACLFEKIGFRVFSLDFTLSIYAGVMNLNMQIHPFSYLFSIRLINGAPFTKAGLHNTNQPTGQRRTRNEWLRHVLVTEDFS